MFTGIVSTVGKIVSVQPLDKGVRLKIALAADGAADWLRDVVIGDSIAHNGVCLTVISKHRNGYSVDVAQASLKVTYALDQNGTMLNLEKSLRLQDFIGGHLVAGHVDGLGVVEDFSPVGSSYRLEIKAPKSLVAMLAVKGSIAVNGVAFTINAVRGRRFTVNVIPHTLAITTLRLARPGSLLHLEADLIARYVYQALNTLDKRR